MTGRILHLAKSLSFTDKCSKKRLLSVNSQHNGPKFTDTSMKMGMLSVNSQHNGPKFTDKSAKKGSLSVNQDEILVELVERHCI